MKVKIILGILILGLCAWGYFFVTDIIKEREKNERINPAIYPAFRKVELAAMMYLDLQIVDKDKYHIFEEVLRLYKEAGDSSIRTGYGTPNDEYYIALQRLGFDLPPLYLDRKPTKEETEKAFKEQKAIRESQTDYIEKSKDKLLKEINGILKSKNE